MPTHNNYKSSKSNYPKKKRYFSKDKMRPPAKRPVTFLNKVGEKSEEIMKNVNGNLNKLSNQNYDKIWENVKKIYIDNKDDFDYVAYVESIFDKATSAVLSSKLNDMINQLKELEQMKNLQNL